MLDEISITLLRKIFVGSTSAVGIKAQKFRADNYEHLELIESLVSSGYIEDRDGNYSLKLTTLPEIQASTPQVGSLLYLCEHLFKTLRQAYLDNPGTSISLDKLSELADLPRLQIYAGIPYLSQASLICGYSTDLTTSDSFVTPAEKLLKHKSFAKVIEEMQSWKIKTATVQNSSWNAFTSKINNPPIFGSGLTFEHLLHPVISEHALPKYKDGHLRNAVLDSIIAVFDLIRQKTGLGEDGDELIGKVFSLADPYLVLNEIETESGKNEQKGFIQIFKGVFQGIRNPKAHSLSHDLTQIEAAQCLILASLLAQRIEEAKVIKSQSVEPVISR